MNRIVATYIRTPVDIKIIWLSVFLRLSAFGATNIVLTLFLKAIGVTETSIGIFMTTTLVGDTLISYFLTWYADALGRRRVMRFGSFLMAVAGLMFAVSDSFWVLLAAAIVGVISPSGDEVGPFRSVEESTIAHLTPLEDRPDVYAIHWLISSGGSAIGTLVTGWTLQWMQDKSWSELRSYRAIFYGYSAVSVTKFVVMMFLSDKCETTHGEHVSMLEPEEAPLVAEAGPSVGLSRETVHVLTRLLCVFMLDSFAYGFMPTTWIIYYFKTTYLLDPSVLGSLFFLTIAVNSLSSLPSASVARAFGPIKATLLVQVPSALFLTATPMFSHIVGSGTSLLLYYATSAMDVVPRQVLLTGLIPPRELTKAMGVVNIGKTFARCIGPVFTGKLAAHGYLWVGFIITGSVTLCADFLLFILFYGVDSKMKH